MLLFYSSQSRGQRTATAKATTAKATTTLATTVGTEKLWKLAVVVTGNDTVIITAFAVIVAPAGFEVAVAAVVLLFLLLLLLLLC